MAEKTVSITANLLKDIKNAGIANISGARYSTHHGFKISNWLCQWIEANLDLESGARVVSGSLSQNNEFWAKMGLNSQNMTNVSNLFDQAIQKKRSALRSINQYSDQMFLGDRDSPALERALFAVHGRNNANTPEAKGLMLMQLVAIFNQVRENNSNPQVLAQELQAELSQKSHLFSRDFISETRLSLKEMIANEKQFMQPLSKQQHLIDFLSQDEFAQLTDTQINELITNPVEARTEAANFLNNYSLENPRALSEDLLNARNLDYSKLSSGAKAFLALRAREASAISNLQGKNISSLSSLLSNSNVGSLIYSSLLGLMTGGLFGCPKLGLMITALINLFGESSSSKPTPPAEPVITQPYSSKTTTAA
jgi:hypothetical protein